MNRTKQGLIGLAAVLLLAGMSLPQSAVAGEENNFEWKTWRTRRSHAGFNGHGGFFFSYLNYDGSALKSLADAMGIDHLNDALVGFGGHGMGYVGGGWRVGGEGWGYSARTDGVVYLNGDKFKREMNLR
ncbi:MAG TPA: hypothetical protein ENI92_09480, partial [Bacteroidetes bacterium]|nr:hypothetical protein [Bacteroidota bacterium]